MPKRADLRSARMLRQGNAVKRRMGRYLSWWGAAMALVGLRIVQVNTSVPLPAVIALGVLLATGFLVSGQVCLRRDDRRPLYLCCLLLWLPTISALVWAAFAGVYSLLVLGGTALAANYDRKCVRTGISPDLPRRSLLAPLGAKLAVPPDADLGLLPETGSTNARYGRITRNTERDKWPT